MSPSDRLEELKRQRAQLAEQMARLDQEAAAAAAQTPPSEPKKTGSEAADPDQVLAQFAHAPVNPADVKRGCITAFILGLAVVAAALVAVYFAFYR